jgi:hypothetical protein
MSAGMETTKPKPNNRAMEGILQLLFGPTVWLLHFMIIYAVQSTFCSFGAPAIKVLSFDLVRFAAFVITALALGTIAAAMWRIVPMNPKPRLGDQHGLAPFFRNSARILCLLSAIAIIWTSVPAFAVHSCASLR